MASSTEDQREAKLVTDEKVHDRGDLTETGSEEGPERIAHVHAKTYLTVFAVCMLYFAQLINVVGAGAQTQDIVAVLGDSSNGVWLTSVIAIMTVVLSPPVSQAADYWGRRWFLIGLTACGIIGSIIVARATSTSMAIAGFTVTSISFGAQPLLHAVNSEILPRRQRPYAQGVTNASAAAGGLVALLAGGSLTRYGNAEGFRNYWYMCMAIYVLATVLVAVLYTPPKTPRQLEFTNAEKLGKLDWVGYFLLTAGLVLFCIGLSWSQNPYPWSDAHVIAPFVIGIVLTIVLIAYETFVKKDGMLHHDLFNRGRNFPIALFSVFVEGLVFYAANNYFAFEVSVLYETDSLLVGLRYGIMMITYGTTAVLVGAYCSLTHKIRIPAVVGFLFMVIFFVLMAVSNPNSGRNVWGYPVLLGVALGSVLCSLVTIAQLSTPKELIAITSGLMIGMRSFGGAVGIAIFNAIFTDQLSHLGDNIAAAVIPAGLPQSSVPGFIENLAGQNNTGLALVPGVNPQIIGAGVGALLDTYSDGFRYVWVAAGAFTAIAVVGEFLFFPSQRNSIADLIADMIVLAQLLFSLRKSERSSTTTLTRRRRRMKTYTDHRREPWHAFSSAQEFAR
jgi:MFS family permease